VLGGTLSLTQSINQLSVYVCPLRLKLSVKLKFGKNVMHNSWLQTNQVNV